MVRIISVILFICFSVSAQAQFRAEFQYILSGTVDQGGTYSLRGLFSDNDQIGYSVDSIDVGDFFIDKNGQVYQIVHSSASSPLELEVDPVGDAGTPVTGNGLLSESLYNIYFETAGIPDKLRSLVENDFRQNFIPSVPRIARDTGFIERQELIDSLSNSVVTETDPVFTDAITNATTNNGLGEILVRSGADVFVRDVSSITGGNSVTIESFLSQTGSNVVLSQTPTGAVQVKRSGISMTQGADFSVSSDTITFNLPLEAENVLVIY